MSGERLETLGGEADGVEPVVADGCSLHGDVLGAVHLLLRRVDGLCIFKVGMLPFPISPLIPLLRTIAVTRTLMARGMARR